MELAKKYIDLLRKKEILKIIVYNDKVIDNDSDGNIINWADFISLGSIVGDQ